MRLCRANIRHSRSPFLCTYLLDSSQLFLMVHCNTSGVRTPGRTSPLAIIAELSEAATAVVVTARGYGDSHTSVSSPVDGLYRRSICENPGC